MRRDRKGTSPTSHLAEQLLQKQKRERTNNTHGHKAQVSCKMLIIPHSVLPSPASPHEPFCSAGSLPEPFFRRFAADVIIRKCTIRELWYLSVLLDFNFTTFPLKTERQRLSHKLSDSLCYEATNFLKGETI